MINENITKMIAEAMKSGNKIKTEVYRAIKNEFLKFNTSGNGKELNETEEINILNKMVKERCTTADIYEASNRSDLAKAELNEVKYIQELLPAQATEDDIRNYIEDNYSLPLAPRMMGVVIKGIKENLTNVDGRILASIVKSYIK